MSKSPIEVRAVERLTEDDFEGREVHVHAEIGDFGSMYLENDGSRVVRVPPLRNGHDRRTGRDGRAIPVGTTYHEQADLE
jgi:hypothetical protein